MFSCPSPMGWSEPNWPTIIETPFFKKKILNVTEYRVQSPEPGEVVGVEKGCPTQVWALGPGRKIGVGRDYGITRGRKGCRVHALGPKREIGVEKGCGVVPAGRGGVIGCRGCTWPGEGDRSWTARGLLGRAGGGGVGLCIGAERG